MVTLGKRWAFSIWVTWWRAGLTSLTLTFRVPAGSPLAPPADTPGPTLCWGLPHTQDFFLMKRSKVLLLQSIDQKEQEMRLTEHFLEWLWILMDSISLFFQPLSQIKSFACLEFLKGCSKGHWYLVGFCKKRALQFINSEKHPFGNLQRSQPLQGFKQISSKDNL